MHLYMIYTIDKYVNLEKWMSKVKLCRLCAGQRKVQGMGFMMQKCPECEGKGVVKNDHYVCDICSKEITLDAAKKVVEEKKTRAKKISKDIVSTDDMSLIAHDDAASF